jgi:hypothetical protein
VAHARRILALAAVSLLLIGVAETPVGAQTDPSTTFTQPPLPDGAGSILGPKPGQGVAPTQSGDRGGVAQLTLFGFIIAAVAGGALLVRRDMSRAKARQATRIDGS